MSDLRSDNETKENEVIQLEGGDVPDVKEENRENVMANVKEEVCPNVMANVKEEVCENIVMANVKEEVCEKVEEAGDIKLEEEVSVKTAVSGDGEEKNNAAEDETNAGGQQVAKDAGSKKKRTYKKMREDAGASSNEPYLRRSLRFLGKEGTEVPAGAEYKRARVATKEKPKEVARLPKTYYKGPVKILPKGAEEGEHQGVSIGDVGVEGTYVPSGYYTEEKGPAAPATSSCSIGSGNAKAGRRN